MKYQCEEVKEYRINYHSLVLNMDFIWYVKAINWPEACTIAEESIEETEKKND
jgi:hypothetical protein